MKYFIYRISAKLNFKEFSTMEEKKNWNKLKCKNERRIFCLGNMSADLCRIYINYFYKYVHMDIRGKIQVYRSTGLRDWIALTKEGSIMSGMSLRKCRSNNYVIFNAGCRGLYMNELSISAWFWKAVHNTVPARNVLNGCW